MKPTGHSLIDQEIGKQLGEDEVVLLADGLESSLPRDRETVHPPRSNLLLQEDNQVPQGYGDDDRGRRRILRLQYRRSLCRRPNSSLPTGRMICRNNPEMYTHR
jgi:hypothetical protein